MLKFTTLHAKTIFLITSISLQLLTISAVQAGTADPLFSGAVTAMVDDHTALTQGYLLVYSATDRFDDDGVPYNPHSSYSIYTTNGRLFKKVENHIAPSDENPELVTLPAGSYAIELRSERRGYVRMPVIIAAGRETVVDPDKERAGMAGTRLAPIRHAGALATP